MRTIAASWNNDDPASFTNKPVDVIFKVNANSPYMPAGGPSPHHLWLDGDTNPLSFSSFPPLRQFGLVTSAAFLLALIADFTALPAGLWMIDRRRRGGPRPPAGLA